MQQSFVTDIEEITIDNDNIQTTGLVYQANPILFLLRFDTPLIMSRIIPTSFV